MTIHSPGSDPFTNGDLIKLDISRAPRDGNVLRPRYGSESSTTDPGEPDREVLEIGNLPQPACVTAAWDQTDLPLHSQP